MARRPDRFVWELDWNLLRTFVAIAEEKGITRAGDRLSLKQPTVSNALSRLESQAGRRLVERSANHFELTEAGRVVYEASLEMLGLVSRLPVLMRDARDEVTGHVEVDVASHVVTPLFDAALAAFHREHPRATVSISVLPSSDVLKRVRERRASFGLCLVNQKEAALAYELVYREFFGLFCGPPHRLFGKRGLTLADLADETSVSFHTDTIFDALRPVALLRSEARLKANVVGVSSNLEEVRRMIVAGMGIGPMPLHVVQRDVSDGLLWRLPPYDAPPAIDIFLVTNVGKSMNRAETALLEELRRRIADMPMTGRTYDR